MADLKFIRAMHELPAICFFCKTFEKDLNLKGFNIDELENSLLDTNKNSFVSDLHIKLLQGLSKQRPNTITVDTWEHVLKSEIDKRRKLYFYFFITNPLETGPYATIDLRSKILILKGLCDWRLDDNEDISNQMRDELFASSLRLEPIGKDAQNNNYYYFDDLRLYKEIVTPTAAKKRGRKPKPKPNENSDNEQSSGEEIEGDEGEAGSHESEEESTESSEDENSITNDEPQENRRVTRSRSNVASNTNNKPTKSKDKPKRTRKSKPKPTVSPPSDEKEPIKGSDEEIVEQVINKPNGKHTTADVHSMTSSEDKAAKAESTPNVQVANGELELRTSEDTPNSTIEGEAEPEAKLQPKIIVEEGECPATWELICSSLAEWEALIGTFADSRNKEEKLLLDRVSTDIFPYVSNKFMVMARQRAKQEVHLPIKRSSRIQEKEKEKLETLRLMQQRKSKQQTENKQQVEEDKSTNSRAERLKARENKRRKLEDGSESDSEKPLEQTESAINEIDQNGSGNEEVKIGEQEKQNEIEEQPKEANNGSVRTEQSPRKSTPKRPARKPTKQEEQTSEDQLTPGMRTRKRNVSLTQILERAQARIDEFGDDESKKKIRPKREKVKKEETNSVPHVHPSANATVSTTWFPSYSNQHHNPPSTPNPPTLPNPSPNPQSSLSHLLSAFEAPEDFSQEFLLRQQQYQTKQLLAQMQYNQQQQMQQHNQHQRQQQMHAHQMQQQQQQQQLHMQMQPQHYQHLSALNQQQLQYQHYQQLQQQSQYSSDQLLLIRNRLLSQQQQQQQAQPFHTNRYPSPQSHMGHYEPHSPTRNSPMLPNTYSPKANSQFSTNQAYSSPLSSHLSGPTTSVPTTLLPTSYTQNSLLSQVIENGYPYNSPQLRAPNSPSQPPPTLSSVWQSDTVSTASTSPSLTLLPQSKASHTLDPPGTSIPTVSSISSSSVIPESPTIPAIPATHPDQAPSPQGPSDPSASVDSVLNF